MTTQNKNVPTLRFPEFVEDWQEKEYIKIFSFKVTNSLSRENLNYESGNVKNLHYGDIHTKFNTLFDITKECVPFINSDIKLNKVADENYCKEGDLVIADASEDYADIGKCIEITNLNNEKVLAGLHTFLARPDLCKMPIGFSGYLMKSPKVRLQIMIIAQGTKVLSISTSRLSKIKLTIPKEEIEQQKIAAFLTAVDEKIQQLAKKKELLGQYKKGVMQKIFNQEIRFKDDNGNDFADWEEKKLGEFFTERNEQTEGKLPLYSLTIEAGIVPKSKRYEREFLLKSEEEAYKVMRKNDFAFNPMNLRFGALARHKGDMRVLVSKYYNIFFCNEKVDVRFVETYLTSFKLIQFYNKMATGSLMEKKRVHYLDFVKFKLLLPSLPEQQKIADFLSAIDDKINSVSQQLQKTKEYKKGLLQQMFI